MEMKRIQVGISIAEDELDAMRRFARVDANGPAVLAMARRGREECERDAERASEQ